MVARMGRLKYLRAAERALAGSGHLPHWYEDGSSLVHQVHAPAPASPS